MTGGKTGIKGVSVPYIYFESVIDVFGSYYERPSNVLLVQPVQTIQASFAIGQKFQAYTVFTLHTDVTVKKTEFDSIFQLFRICLKQRYFLLHATNLMR